MTSYVYAVDFGEVRKIGVSGNAEARIKSLARDFGLSPQKVFIHNVTNGHAVEYRAKEMLNEFSKPFANIKTETFACEFSECVRALCDADDYDRLKQNDAKYEKLCYEARLSKGSMRMIYSVDCRDHFIDSAIQEKFKRENRAIVNDVRFEMETVQLKLDKKALAWVGRYGASEKINSILIASMDKEDYNSQG